MKAVTEFISLVSKITADSDCSCRENKQTNKQTNLVLGSKAMKNLDRIVKSIDIALQAKICRVKAMIFQKS